MMKKCALTAVAGLVALSATLANAKEQSCGWQTYFDITKATAADKQCDRAVGFNINADNPRKGQWLSECKSLVNMAVASCADSDIACVKRQVTAMYPSPICDLSRKYGP